MDIGYEVVRVGSDSVGARNSILSNSNIVGARNDVLSVCNITTNVRNSSIGIDCKLGLEKNNQGRQQKSGLTHIEYSEELVELQFPGHDLLFITLRMDESRNTAAFPLLGHLPFDFHNSYTTKRIIWQPSNPIAGLTHAIDCFIASRADSLRSSNLFPFVP